MNTTTATPLGRFLLILATGLSCLLLIAAPAHAHDGPDPIAHWIFNNRSIQKNVLRARLGPDGKISGDTELIDDPYGQSLLLAGPQAGVVITENFQTAKKFLPAGPFTVSAWFSVDTRQRWGSVCGVIQDNGESEQGWLLGYSERNFYFGLASQGADDGDGKMTYLNGQIDYEKGRLYHVVGVYDGKQMQLYVNGKLDAETDEQQGAILYPDTAPLTIGLYKDANEHYPHHGRIRDIALYNLAAKPAWVAKQFELNEQLARLPSKIDTKLRFVVKPYLQMATRTSIVISWQTSRPADTTVRFSEYATTSGSAIGVPEKIVHHVKLENLKPNTQYFYKAVSRTEDGQELESEVRTFQTACNESTPFAFAVISDTQGNPTVASQVAAMAWAQRPSFLIHPGDLVSTGTSDRDWTNQFFPSMHELISRVPMYPVLGNHEVNARNYYDYMLLPDPEYYYQFKYGNAHFFMIDTNKKVDPESEQFQWLDDALGNSESKWKFVVHHHPPYSSDENDYGNLWKTNRSTRGDLRVRALTKLYDKHGVDIVFNGHIHSYERTWPVKGDRAAAEGQGTVYMITGGGGGGLETPGPFRPFFQNNVKRGHHYGMVHINDGTLEWRAFDLEGRLFDTMKLSK